MDLRTALLLRPRRTIRVVLWTNEENGLVGARRYVLDHGKEVPDHVAAIESHDTTSILCRIAAPALVLMGDQEWLNPKADADIMLAGIANSRLEVLEGGGHGFLWEIPEAFNQAVMDFLAANPL